MVGCRILPRLVWWLVSATLTFAAEFPRLQLDSWTTANGLPHNSIRSLVETRDGFLWLTTLNGLARFDGLNFRVFQTGNTKGLRSNNFNFALWEDRAGTLWAGTDSGVTRYRNGEFRTFTEADGLPSNEIKRIDGDAGGTVWIYTATGIATWKGDRFARVENLPASLTQASYREKVGYDCFLYGLWRLTPGGWERFAYGKWSRFPIPASVGDPGQLRIRSIYEDTRHRLWFDLLDDASHYYCVENGALREFDGFGGFHSGAFVTYQDTAGLLWLSDHAGGTARWRNGQMERVEGITTYRIFRMLEDREGNEWIATQGQGLFRVRVPSITSIRHPGGAEIGAALVRDRNGVLWIGSVGLVRRDSHGFRLFRRTANWKERWSPNIVLALHEDAAGTLWVGTRQGLCTFHDGEFVAQPLGDDTNAPITALADDGQGKLAIGTKTGLLFLQDGRISAVAGEGSQSIGAVRTLLYQGGTLWIGTDRELLQYAGGRLCPIAGEGGRPFGAINTLMSGKQERLWIGTEQNGIFRLFRNKTVHYERAKGLPNDGVDQLLEDDKGDLWCGGGAGLFRLSKAELDQFAEGRLKRITATRFTKQDGLVDDDFMDSGQPACLKTRDGRLWFTTLGAVSIVDPRHIQLRPAIDRPVIDECVLDRKEAACGSAIAMGPAQDNLEIRYTAVDFVKPEQVRFRYRLRGLDQEWIEADNRRAAYYSHLPPGRYDFELRAANSDGVWSPHAATMAVTVLPAFYQTWWFLVLLLSSAAALLHWSWRRRVFQLQQAHSEQQAFSRELIESQERERKRIAAELHDSLGQRLIMINNLALLSMETLEDSKVHGRLREISTEATQAIGEVKEISYNLRPFRLDRLGLTKTLDWIIRSTASATQLTISAELAMVDGLLPRDSEINLFRIVQECLGNIVKHARATEVSVCLSNSETTLVLTVRDNGIGFTPEARSEDMQAGGFGLIGITERASLLGGSAHIESTPGQGTTVRVEIQLAGEQHER